MSDLAAVSGSAAATAADTQPTLVLRPFAGNEDYPVLAELSNAARIGAGAFFTHTAESIAVAYENVAGSDPRQDIVLAMRAGRPVGFVRTEWRDERAGQRLHAAVLYVDRARAPTETEPLLLLWAEAHAQAVAANTPTARPRVLAVFPWLREPADGRFLEDAGYEIVRHELWMRRPSLDDLPELALPAGIEIRPVRTDQLEAIFEAEVEAFGAHWGSSTQDASDASYRRFTGDPTNDLSLWRVAWAGRQVVGMVRGFVNEAENRRTGRQLGWCENISVREPWRGRGVARALIAATLREFRARGLTEAALTVDADNATGAARLYRSMGFQEVARHAEWRRPFEPAVAAPGLEAGR